MALEPHQICKVACHNSILDTAREARFVTAFVHRPMEWGLAGPPDIVDVSPKAECDVVVETFQELVRAPAKLQV